MYERDSKGRFVKGLIPYNTGKGMSAKDKAAHRRDTVRRSNAKRKEKVAQWHRDNPDKVKVYKQRYANSERGRAKRTEISHNRIAREKSLVYKFNRDYWSWLCNRLGYKCQHCQKVFKPTDLTVDHQLPINRSGDNQEWNIQPLCKSCNCSKQDNLRRFDLENLELEFAYYDWLEEVGVESFR